VGVCDGLRADDIVAPTYRVTRHILRRRDLNAMFAELYGKGSGCSHGKGGSMHMIDMNHGILGASAVVAPRFRLQSATRCAGTEGKVACRCVLRARRRKKAFLRKPQFCGTASSSRVVCLREQFICIHTPIEKRWATRRLAERVETSECPLA